MKNLWYYSLLLFILFSSCSKQLPENAVFQDKVIAISPDYSHGTIPWNIAPLNFSINVEADDYLAALYSSKGEKIIAGGKQVEWNLKSWHRLLEANKGDTLYTEIYLKKGNQWTKHPLLKNVIAPDAIDEYISYRLIEPSYVTYELMTINQRNLTNFDEKVIYDNSMLSSGENGQCINCHSYQNYNRTGNMQFHVRQHLGGTVIVTGDNVTKVSLKTEHTISAGVYPAWHPTENLIAYSTNNTSQNFHTRDPQKVEVMDSESALILYDVTKNEVKEIVNEPNHLETFPAWSPDGKYLYYVSAAYPENINKDSENLYLEYKDFRYNIYRKAFNPETYEFTATDTIFEASEYGKSATFPRVSPDGRYLLFTLGDFGNFHIWHKSSDLYLLDMETWTLSALAELNSPDVESYHSWSSNGRWIIFSSRRDDGSYTRPYIGYFKDGKASKPFILPQKSPDFYGEFFKSYNIPEFMVEPVKVSRKNLVDAIKKDAQQATFNNELKKPVIKKDEKENFYE
ncbi:MAG: Protein TolB [Candidatus Ordinivivax streblomastigis]|uniref:Protein TolB n=1 Tax=Candidatus Ordinivivax streblomastigis TaxID=2540710 RepID=A0A5M8P048_9BACT|nr:MAG: Protein TolB [Candidatus Ordinivivax streblomastigis]